MSAISLVEYHRVGEAYQPSGNTFTFGAGVPRMHKPRSIKKDIEVKWRIRRPGHEAKIERARFRYNEKIELTLSGACKGEYRAQLEWFAKRDSLFRVTGLPLKTYHSEETPDCQMGGTPSSWPAAKALGEEEFFVVFESTNFTLAEALEDWYEYSIKFRRVHLARH